MDIAQEVASGGRFTVSNVCRVLDVARSAYYELRRAKVKSTDREREASDKRLLERITNVVSERTTYGYRRVTAVLGRDATSEGAANHKRVYRVMKENKLLLTRAPIRPTRTHDGQVVTAASNMRWCSDAFCVRCENGQCLYVVFCLDCHDREVLSWRASTGGIGGQLVRDMMVEAVDTRCGGRLPHCIQWLSDNGPCYVARKTVELGRQLGFEMCTTSPYSPQSNGMAEAFVKTFKRDYVYAKNAPLSPEQFMQKLPGYFEDYNTFAPHKGLGMKTPTAYRALNGTD